MKILIIEDEDGLRELLEDGLGERGFDCLSAESAEDALQMLPHFVPDVALVDIFMRGQGGISAIQMLRNRVPGCLIVAMSGGWGDLSPDQSLQAAREVGADLTISKPFTIEQVETLIRTLQTGGPAPQPPA